MFFEKAMIALVKHDKEECKKYLKKGIENNEVYAYYLADQFLMDIDIKKYEELKNEDNPYSMAVKGKELLYSNEKKAVDLLKSSDCGVAKYELYLYFIEYDNESLAKKYLFEAIDYDFPLAYKEYAKDLRSHGPITDLCFDGPNRIEMCDKAISYGFVDGYYAKALMYEEGYYLNKDLKKAIELYNQLPDSEYSYRNIELIKAYYNLADYNKVYQLCSEYIEKEELYTKIALQYMGYIYEQETFSEHDLIKSLIYKKSLMTSYNCENSLIEISNIYYSKLNNKYMASLYSKFFQDVVDYNDTCMSLFDKYIEMVFELEEYEEKNIDNSDYYKIGMDYYKNKDYQSAYDAYIKGFLLDQKKCYKELIKFYFKGLIVNEDMNVVYALAKALNNILVFEKRILDE